MCRQLVNVRWYTSRPTQWLVRSWTPDPPRGAIFGHHTAAVVFNLDGETIVRAADPDGNPLPPAMGRCRPGSLVGYGGAPPPLQSPPGLAPSAAPVVDRGCTTAGKYVAKSIEQSLVCSPERLQTRRAARLSWPTWTLPAYNGITRSGCREAPRDTLSGVVPGSVRSSCTNANRKAFIRASRMATRPLSSVTTGVVRGDSAASSHRCQHGHRKNGAQRTYPPSVRKA